MSDTVVYSAAVWYFRNVKTGITPVGVLKTLEYSHHLSNLRGDQHVYAKLIFPDRVLLDELGETGHEVLPVLMERDRLVSVLAGLVDDGSLEWGHSYIDGQLTKLWTPVQSLIRGRGAFRISDNISGGTAL